jgi:HlyD family secretion protein
MDGDMNRKFHHLAYLFALCLFMASCSRHPSGEAQGYIEGRYTYVATSVPGTLMQLLVERGTKVQAGQPLFVLQSQPESDVYQAAIEKLTQAKDARAAATADLQYDKLTFERNKVLVPKHAVQQSELDKSKAEYDASIAKLAEADATIAEMEANLASAKWNNDQKNINAPVDAIVFDTYYRIGEYTVANQPIVSLLAPQDIKVIFYIREKDLGGISLRDKVTVNCNGCTQAYDGQISFISPTAEYTPPVIFSNETSAKLIYRIEASFAPEVAMRLHPGQPVRVAYFPHD